MTAESESSTGTRGRESDTATSVSRQNILHRLKQLAHDIEPNSSQPSIPAGYSDRLWDIASEFERTSGLITQEDYHKQVHWQVYSSLPREINLPLLPGIWLTVELLWLKRKHFISPIMQGKRFSLGRPKQRDR